MSRCLLIAVTAVVAASVTPARAQQVRVLDLGHGMFEAITDVVLVREPAHRRA